LPFVYYGEEIGMTGDKPDPRIRTPMQWRPGHGTGFTTGTPWQNAQPDSQTTTVEAQDADSASLLNLYRTLIHLRKSNDALAVGRLVPLSTGSATVTAYLRREGDRAVLVVANLGDAPATGLVLSGAAGVLPPGSYQPRSLLGGPDGAVLEVGADGSVQGYQPVPGALAPRASMVLDLIRQ